MGDKGTVDFIIIPHENNPFSLWWHENQKQSNKDTIQPYNKVQIQSVWGTEEFWTQDLLDLSLSPGLAIYLFFNFTILYWFCHISTWIRHRYTRVPDPEPSSLLPPHTLPLGRPSAPAPSIQYRASNLDWRLISYMILYMFQCHSPKSSHPLPQSPKHCSIHQCLFCSLVYRVIVTIFLNSIYMR